MNFSLFVVKCYDRSAGEVLNNSTEITILATGKKITAYPTLSEANNYLYTLQEAAIRDQQRDKFVIGTPAVVTENLWDWNQKG